MNSISKSKEFELLFTVIVPLYIPGKVEAGTFTVTQILIGSVGSTLATSVVDNASAISTDVGCVGYPAHPLASGSPKTYCPNKNETLSALIWLLSLFKSPTLYTLYY